MARPFLLLEVVIAIALIPLCTIPLITPFLWMVQEESTLTQKMEMQRQEALVFCQLIESLYRNEYSWNQIQSNELLGINTSNTLGIPENWPYTASFRSKQRERTKKETIKLLDIAIEIQPVKEKKPSQEVDYRYVLSVEKTDNHSS